MCIGSIALGQDVILLSPMVVEISCALVLVNMEESNMEKEFSVKLENRSGELARMTEILQKDGVNIRAISTEQKAEVVRIVTSDPEKARMSLSQSKMQFSERNLLVAKLEDRPGELARISGALAKEGVNIDAAYMLDKDPKHVHVALAVSDENKARNVLKL